jgi:hypothetical protein
MGETKVGRASLFDGMFMLSHGPAGEFMNKSLRFYAGVVFFVLAWTLPLFGLLVAKLNLSLAAKATIIGLLTVGGPEFVGTARGAVPA